MADSLFPYTDPIGETVYLSGIPFTVAGTYYQKDGGTEDSMDDMVSVPYSLNRELLESADVTAITVKVDTSDHVETVLNALDAYLAERISSSVGEYSLENGNSAMTESTEETASGMGTISLSRITSNSLSGSLNVAARTLEASPWPPMWSSMTGWDRAPPSRWSWRTSAPGRWHPPTSPMRAPTPTERWM